VNKINTSNEKVVIKAIYLLFCNFYRLNNTFMYDNLFYKYKSFTIIKLIYINIKLYSL